MRKSTLYIAFFIIALVANTSFVRSQSQDYDSLLNYYLSSDSTMLDVIEKELSAGDLDIDDLIANLLGKKLRYSQFTARLGYTSSITYAGRDFGIDQQGFGLGATYYHHSGIFADLSGYWNSDLEPNYNPTIGSVGYLGLITPKWSYSLSYDHYFYNMPDSSDGEFYYPFTNSFNATSYYDIGKMTISADYSLLFGEESAHRVRGSLMYTFTKSKIGFIDRLVFMPAISVLMGNSDIYKISPVYPDLNYQTKFDIRKLMIETYGWAQTNYLWRNDRAKYREYEKLIYDTRKDELADYVIDSDNVFGVMNYSLSAPIYMYIGHFTIGLTYHYNIPVELPGEDLDATPNSYIGATLMYNIPFIKSK